MVRDQKKILIIRISFQDLRRLCLGLVSNLPASIVAKQAEREEGSGGDFDELEVILVAQ
jgi:hypothetical protein